MVKPLPSSVILFALMVNPVVQVMSPVKVVFVVILSPQAALKALSVFAARLPTLKQRTKSKIFRPFIIIVFICLTLQS